MAETIQDNYKKVREEIDETCYEVMEYLAAQEPMVMTWRDVIGAALECKPVYIEVKDSEDKERGDDRWAMLTQYKDSIANGMIRAMSSYVTSEVLFADWYNKSYRCWTSRPDEKTREATPWNAQGQRDHEAAVEMAEYCERYEPTYNADDGSM